MPDIALISCTKKKKTTRAPAALMYTSALFRKSLLYSLGNCDRAYILSAKHGVLGLSDVIDPYDLSIKQLSVDEKRLWVDIVNRRLEQVITKRDTVHLLCGQEYYKPTFRTLRRIGC